MKGHILNECPIRSGPIQAEIHFFDLQANDFPSKIQRNGEEWGGRSGLKKRESGRMKNAF